MENDYYYKGIHYVKYLNLLNNQLMVKFSYSDFKLMKDHIEDLEMEICRLTGKHFNTLKEKE